MGNKSILMSIQPKWVAKMLNGEKTIEIRKRFPKDYVGWVYIYCTKGNWKNCLGTTDEGKYDYGIHEYINYPYAPKKVLNGKVVARFWCDEVEKIRCSWGSNFVDWSKYPSDERYDYYIGNEMDTCDICRVACLKMEELDNYLKGKKGYAIHISKVEVFDKPMELTMFRKPEFNKNIYDNNGNRLSLFERLRKYSITKAPQSYQFIEGD